MSETQPADIVLDERRLNRLHDLAVGVGDNLYRVIRRSHAAGRDEVAVTLFVFAISAMLGKMLAAFPNPSNVAPQINALWRVLRIPFRIEITRVQ